MRRYMAALIALQIADLATSLHAVALYGPSVEVNPLVGAVLRLGVLGLVAWKCALLAVILAAAALNPRRRRVLLVGGLLAGIVGAASGLAATV
jgi:hypothetical protein